MLWVFLLRFSFFFVYSFLSLEIPVFLLICLFLSFSFLLQLFKAGPLYRRRSRRTFNTLAQFYPQEDEDYEPRRQQIHPLSR